MTLRTLGIAALAVACTTGAVLAQGMSLGEFEYRNSCAVCHGVAGTGDGPLAAYMTVAAPDLTRLQAENDGIFPLHDAYAVIDGSARVAPHGMLDMPVWGNRYRARMGAEDMDFRPRDVERYVQMRILALIDYLASIQVE